MTCPQPACSALAGLGTEKSTSNELKYEEAGHLEEYDVPGLESLFPSLSTTLQQSKQVRYVEDNLMIKIKCSLSPAGFILRVLIPGC